MEKDPKNLYSLTGVGNCYRVNKKYSSAEKAYKESLKINENFDYGILMLAELYDVGKKPDKAVIYYKKYLEVKPDASNADEIRKKIQALKQ